jgi:phosphoribosylanthranilate isomerase
MALKTLVKIGGVNNLSDARYCAGMGVDMLGFDLNQGHEGFVDPVRFAEISGWISGADYVGEVHDMDVPAIQQTSKQYNLQILEVNEPDKLDQLDTIGIPVILSVNAKDYRNESALLDSLKKHNARCFATIVAFDKTLPGEKILSNSGEFRLILSGSASGDVINNWVEEYNIFGVELKGGNEIKPGFKNFDDLADVLEILEIED